MHFTIIFSSALAFAISAFSQALKPTPGYSYVYFPYKDEVVGAGTTYTIAWDAVELIGPATLFLLGGNDPATLHLWTTIASVNVNDAEYEWAIDCSLGEEEIYVIKIASDLDNGETFGISSPFHIQGPNVNNCGAIARTARGPAATHPSRQATHQNRRLSVQTGHSDERGSINLK